MQGVFDDFFFYVITVVSVFSFADWLLGESRRFQMRERAGDLWLYLETTGYPQLISDDVKRIHSFAQRLFGKHFLSRSRLRRCFVYHLAATVAFGFVFSTIGLVDNSAIAISPQTRDINVNLQLFISSFVVALLAGLPLSYLSISATIGILGAFKDSKSGWYYPVALIADTSISITLFFASWFLVGVTGWFFSYLSFQTAETVLSFIFVHDDKGLIFGKFQASATIYFSIVFAIVTSLAPTVLHALHILCLVFVKLGRRLIKPMTNLILLRLHESKRGVLSQISIALGVIAKLVQEVFKTI